MAEINSVRQPNPNARLDPFAVDRSPVVTVEIAGTVYDKITQYAYDSDLLQLGDPCSVVIPDPYAQYSISEGDSLKFYVADPEVAGGKPTPKIVGVVVSVDRASENGTGTIINVGGADLGWHLVNNDAPIWKRLEGLTFERLFDLIVDPTWGIVGFRTENDNNTRLKLGGDHTARIFFSGEKA